LWLSLCEITLVERMLVGVGPSLLAAAGMWVARAALGVVSSMGRVEKGEGEGASAGIDAKEEKAELWMPTLAHYAGIPSERYSPRARRR
jgi:hypothetical protein